MKPIGIAALCGTALLSLGWSVADKTGTGDYGTMNDIAVVWPPDRAPIVVAERMISAGLSTLARSSNSMQ